MSINVLHPALYANPGYHLVSGDNGELPDGELARHFVPEGWEELDRGICPCGEVVAWDEKAEVWVPDRSLRVLILTQAETETLWSLSDHDLSETINRQLHYNEPVEEDDEDGPPPDLNPEGDPTRNGAFG